MKLSIIVSVYNEEKTIEKVLEKLISLEISGWEKEIIAVDDESTDGTKNILKLFADRVKIITHEKNRGKGAALKTGFGYSQGDAIIIQDADLEYDPNDFVKLLNVFSRDNPVVYEARVVKREKNIDWRYFLGGKLLTIVVNILFDTRLQDMYTCYKLFSAQLIKSIDFTSCGFEFEAEITIEIIKRGIKIKEVPISYSPRMIAEGKHIRFKDGFIGLKTIIVHRLRK